MKKVEILAPAGNKEKAIAAIKAGCDAIYLAGLQFGARAFSENFTRDELQEIILYAHAYSVKVYVTCNILIFEREVASFLEYVEFLYKNNVDALIMQDLGMIDLVHKTFPNFVIHASTQMNIHNVEGARMALKLGIKRVILARETPLSMVKKIKEETNLEVEVFVQGALCASYSGMCLFARSIGPRSGNRGTCSGACRLPYDILSKDLKVLNQGKYPLSMKDLMTLDYIDKLMEIGIDSFKIEGRMKSASYVYTTVKLYKETRDYYLKNHIIKINKEDLYNLKNIFNRTYTKGFLFNDYDVINENSPNHQGVLVGEVVKSQGNFITIKLKDKVSIHDGLRIIKEDFSYGLILNDFTALGKLKKEGLKGELITLKVNKKIPLNSKVLRTSSYLIENEIKKQIQEGLKIPIKINCIVKKDSPLTLEITDYKNTVVVTKDKPLPSKTKSIQKEEIISKLQKVKNTIYQIDEIKVTLEANLFIPLSHLNNLRREGLDLLTKMRQDAFKKDFKKEKYEIKVPKFERVNAYTILSNKKEDFTAKYTYCYATKDLGVIKKLPKVINDYQNIDREQEYLVGELGALLTLKNVITDFSFNVTNSYTVALLHSLGVKRITLSEEVTDNDIDDLIKAYYKRYKTYPNLELIVKTNMEVMVLKYNFPNYPNMYYLKDRFNNKYRLVRKDNLTYIYDYKKTIRENDLKYFQMGVNYLRDENNLN